MRETTVFTAYLKWHYADGFREVFAVFGNFLWFVSHFFSFKLLIRTLFKPWKRMGESYGDGFELDKIASAFIVNTLMRVVGLVTRLIVLGVGFIAYIAILIFAMAIILIWLVLPLIIIASAVLAFNFFVI